MGSINNMYSKGIISQSPREKEIMKRQFYKKEGEIWQFTKALIVIHF